MPNSRDPLDITKEAIEKALTSSKYQINTSKQASAHHKEKDPLTIKDEKSDHKKTPH